MITFPDIVRITIKNINTGQTIQNLAVFIKLFATRKNNYYFIPEFSDENGTIMITQNWIRNEIKKERNLFLMDYASNLEDCYPKFEVWILNEDEISRAIKAMNLFKSALGTKQEDIDKLAKVDNLQFEPVSKLIELHGEKNIEITLETKETT